MIKKDENGPRAENRFKEIAQKKGWIVTKASSFVNQFKHWDFLLSKHSGDSITQFKVDVKAQKKINRYDKEFTNKYLWVEFTNVRGDPGWLNGDADLIAFENDAGFIIVKREELKEAVSKVINFAHRVERSGEALNKIYTRKDRKDEISLVDINILYNINNKVWTD